MISTHIRGMGHAVFQLNNNRLELKHHSMESVAIARPWITKTGLIAEGWTNQPYIHLDIRTPFGDTVGHAQVETALAESLGPSKEKYRLCGWHIQFVEDTNLGSNHRIFVDLEDLSARQAGLSGMDAGLSLEIAMEALGERVMAECGVMTFQLLWGGSSFCYSLLFINGSPFHVLRITGAAGSDTGEKLIRHREFTPSQTKTAGPGIKTYLMANDPLLRVEAIQELKPESLAFGLPEATKSLQKEPYASNATLLHLGLAAAARQKDLLAHNRVGERDASKNDILRSRSLFNTVLGFTLIAMIAITGYYSIAIFRVENQVKILRQAASTYQTQVESIHALRLEKTGLENALLDLKPVWIRPMNWSHVFTGLAAALPEEAGIDGLSVVENADGKLELSFRAWVKDWGQVQAIEKKLLTTSPFTTVKLSEQRKDLATGVVIFNVTCLLDRLHG